jgi:hypothetical protein
MRIIRLAGAEIELHDTGYTVTRYPEGEVPAIPQDTDEYRARAESLGYGSDTARMSREHELAHHITAALLGLPCSPTMMGQAIGKHAVCWRQEEAAVLALQAFARCVGVDLEAVAERLRNDAPLLAGAAA